MPRPMMRRPATPTEPQSALDRRLRLVLKAPLDLAGAIFGMEPSDQMEGHIDPGRDPCRGDDVAVVDKTVLPSCLDGAVDFQQFLEVVPVCRPSVSSPGGLLTVRHQRG